jgi:UDP-N-acetylmuramyl pentapeptide synthase
MKKNILRIIYNILAIFTRLYLSRTKPFIIGITWSVWKTSCRMIVYQILKKYEKDKIIYTSPKNFNSELWLIFSIFKIEKYNPWIKSLIKITLDIIYKSFFMGKQYDILLLEYWVDHPWDMDFLLTIAKPDISVFTKLDSIHIEYFNDIKSIWNEKIKLIHNTKKKCFLNYSDNFQKNIFKNIKISKSFYWKDILNYKYILDNDSVKAEIVIWNNKIKTNILWDENFIYIDLWYRVLDYLGIDYSIDIDLNFNNQWWRFTIFKWINNSILIDSSYNAWPESMKKMINNTLSIKKELFKNYKVFYVIWDMRELWNYSEEKHKDLYNYIKDKWKIISVWVETKKYFWNDVKNFINSKKAWIFLKNILEKTSDKYIILFKWSQNTIYVEEALKQVLLNTSDVDKLVRQDNFWLEKK